MYSLDYRQRVFEIKKEENLTYAETSKRFKVGMSTLFNWKKKLEPKGKWERPATKIDMTDLARDVKDNPDQYQYERAKKYNVTAWAIGLALKRLQISCKKNHKSPQSR